MYYLLWPFKLNWLLLQLLNHVHYRKVSCLDFYFFFSEKYIVTGVGALYALLGYSFNLNVPKQKWQFSRCRKGDLK